MLTRSRRSKPFPSAAGPVRTARRERGALIAIVCRRSRGRSPRSATRPRRRAEKRSRPGQIGWGALWSVNDQDGLTTRRGVKRADVNTFNLPGLPASERALSQAVAGAWRVAIRNRRRGDAQRGGRAEYARRVPEIGERRALGRAARRREGALATLCRAFGVELPPSFAVTRPSGGGSWRGGADAYLPARRITGACAT